MKIKTPLKIALLAILACLIKSYTSAQSSFFPIKEEEPVWRIKESGFFNFYEEHEVFLGIDTIIDGYQWHSVFMQNSTGIAQLIGFYRIDQQKVYFRSTETTLSPLEEYLLYDFSAETGDTFMLKVSGLPEFYPYQVYETGYIPYNGDQFKYLFLFEIDPDPWLNIPVSLIWIEGIGDYHHPFYPIVCLDNSNCESSNLLACLLKNNSLYFVSPWVDDSDCSNFENGTRLYVDQQAISGMNNGLDWNNAFWDLQDALDLAGPGDSIWVAEGTYYPTSSTDRQISFELKQGVAIYGGFNGTESALIQRNWEENITILSGDIGIPGDSSDNSFHVLYALGVDSLSIVDGFIITLGQGIYEVPGYSGPFNRGGGLYVATDQQNPVCSPTLRNCRFTHNIARDGGAVYCEGLDGKRANPIFRNCDFYQNKATFSGGAIYKWGPSPENGAMIMDNCSFDQNLASGEGGAVCIEDVCGIILFNQCNIIHNVTNSSAGGIYIRATCDSGIIQINQCNFEFNQGSAGGLSIIKDASGSTADIGIQTLIKNCNFIGNTALYGHGGGIALGNFSGAALTTTFEECLFDSNSATNYGGAVWIDVDQGNEINLFVNHSIFNNNRTNSNRAGAISIYGSVGNPMRNQTRIINSLFTQNSGALQLDVGYNGAFQADLFNCTFYQNGIYPIAKYWSPQFNDSTYYLHINLHNCILWEPQTTINRILENGINDVLNGYELRHCLINEPVCNLTGSEFACFEGNLYGQYPMFWDTLLGDFRLSACSPAINAGYSAGLDTMGVFTDLYGLTRIQDNMIDMGVYERPSAWLAAIDTIQSPLCPNGADGVVLFLHSGNDPLSYEWHTIDNSGYDNTLLSEGNYQFILTDALNCKDTVQLEITAPDSIAAVYISTPESLAGASNGALTIDTISGGTAPYRFLWNTGDTTASINSLSTGQYTLTITDEHECSQYLFFDVGLVSESENIQNVIPQFNLQPNPVKSGQFITIHYTGETKQLESKLQIIDITGRLIYKNDIVINPGSGIVELPTANLSLGLYTIVVLVENKEPLVRKVIVVDY
jgi:hypothetical protein